jgi:MFS family permease
MMNNNLTPSDNPDGAPLDDQARTRTMKLSVREGQAWAFMTGAGDSYIIPFAVALTASNLEIGILSSLVGLLGAMCQLVGGRLVYRFRRRSIMVSAAMIQALAWASLSCLAFITPRFSGAPLVQWTILLFALGSMAGSICGPPWFSLIGDIVPENKRGKFFSGRNRRIGLTAMVVTLIASRVLDEFKSAHLVMAGFGALFAVAALGRMVSVSMLSRHTDAPNPHEADESFNLRTFIRLIPTSNFGRFSLYVSLINFATYFAAPFFAVYMLRDLKFDYLWFSLVNLSGGIFSFVSMKQWGRFSDRYGNRALLKLGSMIIPFPPLFWLVSGHPIWLILTTQLVAGVGWAAFNLGASNFIFDAVQPHRRALGVSFHNLIGGIGIFAGAMAGAFFAGHVQVSWMATLPLIFVVSSLMRALVSLIMLRHIREVRPTHNLRTELIRAFWVATQRPGLGMARGMAGLLYNRLVDLPPQDKQ